MHNRHVWAGQNANNKQTGLSEGFPGDIYQPRRMRDEVWQVSKMLRLWWRRLLKTAQYKIISLNNTSYQACVPSIHYVWAGKEVMSEQVGAGGRGPWRFIPAKAHQEWRSGKFSKLIRV